MKEKFLKFLIEKSVGKNVVLLGEMHGTKETPELLTYFFSEYIKDNDFNICLEFSSSEQHKIDDFLDSGDESIIKHIFYGVFENDGRKTLEYLELIKSIYKLNLKYGKNIKIFCVDVEEGYLSEDIQNEREKVIANNILNCIDKLTFVILGNIHASKKLLNIANFEIVPAGYYIFKKLKNGFVNINLIPRKGKFYNFSIKNICFDSISKFDKNFDFNYYIKSVVPATIAENLNKKMN